MSKNIVLGVCGGIAAYKALDIVSRLKKQHFNVDVIMTKEAAEFVTPLSFQSLSQRPVIIDMFAEPISFEIQHISLSHKADLMLIVPATANIIGKVACGIADDMLSTTIMACKSKVVFAPAMNTNMYENKIVQENIRKLKSFGYEFIEPANGRLACGDEGIGKLAATDLITDITVSLLYDKKDLYGKKVIVTAGPTTAPIDPVRYITNKSTGKMGYEIAKVARDRGANVTLVSGNCNLDKPFGVNFVSVNSNEEMLEAILKEYDDADFVIKAAAVADYKVKQYSTEKIKKSDNDLNLPLVRNIDILKELGKLKNQQVLVGFAAESSELISHASDKLSRKNLDFIVANDITSKDTGFASDDNKVVILSKDNEVYNIDKMSKRQVAEKLFDIIINKI